MSFDQQNSPPSSSSYHSLPTGKTKTVVEAILQILRTDPDASVIVCAPSNAATDTVALRLIKHLSIDQLFRLQRPTRSFAEVSDELMPYCAMDQSSFASESDMIDSNDHDPSHFDHTRVHG